MALFATLIWWFIIALGVAMFAGRFANFGLNGIDKPVDED